MVRFLISDDRGFQEEGVKIYHIVPMTAFKPPTSFTVFTSRVYVCESRKFFSSIHLVKVRVRKLDSKPNIISYHPASDKGVGPDACGAHGLSTPITILG
jgi:hypothetical protein